MDALDVYDKLGKKIKQAKLDEGVFDGKVNSTLMHQAVVTFLANQRIGLASSKTKGEVRGGGRKPWRQKGTGRARVGSRRSPLWRGGGVTFGPRPHSYNKTMPRRMRAGALKSVLNTRLKDKSIIVVDSFIMDDHKTKTLFNIIKNLKLSAFKSTIVVKNIDSNLKLASRNLANFSLEKAGVLNSYSALNCERLIFTLEALRVVEERIRKCFS